MPSETASDGLFASLGRINLADSQYHDGNLDSGSDHAYEVLRRQTQTAMPDLKAVALLKFAQVCRRLQRYGEAQDALRLLLRMERSGEVSGHSLACKARLSLAMLRFEQGRIEESRAIANKHAHCNCSDDCTNGEYYNLQGLLATRDLRNCYQAAVTSGIPPDQDALPALLGVAEHWFGQALTMMMKVNDYSAMQATCRNMGNLLIGAYHFKFRLPDHERLLERGIAWVAQGGYICNKFGVGMDSVRSRIALLQAALEGGLELGDLNRLTSGMFKNHVDLESVGQETLSEAMRIGNPLEQAATLRILAKLAGRKGDRSAVEDCRLRALEIYRKFNRADLIRELKKDFPAKLVAP